MGVCTPGCRTLVHSLGYLMDRSVLMGLDLLRSRNALAGIVDEDRVYALD